MTELPKLSFLIATHDHPPDLDRFFRALIGQTLPPDEYEAVIIDASGTRDHALAWQRALKLTDTRLRLHLESIPAGSRAKAYNYGAEKCRAPIILFFADDAIAAAHTAETHLRFHQDNPDRHRVGVGAMLLSKEFHTHFTIWLERSGELFGVPFTDDMTSIPDHFFYAGNSSVKRSLLREAGPFDERFPYHAWDDFEFGLRLSKLGMHASFLPDATAEHLHAITLTERCRTMTQAGESARVFEQIHRGDHPWRHKCRVPPWCFRGYGLVSLALHALSRRERFLISYYRARLNAAFVAGHRNGKADPAR